MKRGSPTAGVPGDMDHHGQQVLTKNMQPSTEPGKHSPIFHHQMAEPSGNTAPFMPPPMSKLHSSGPYSAVPSFMSLQQQASSQRDTQITPPSRLFSGGPGPLPAGGEKDEYLLRLLGRGRPNASTNPSSAATATDQPTASFRVPDPVLPIRPLAKPSPVAAAPPPIKGLPPAAGPSSAGTGAPATASNPEEAARPAAQVDGTNAQNRAATATQAGVTEDACWSYADTSRRMGIDNATQLRSTVVNHQVMFLEQLYDFHRAIAVQKLLVRNCPEVADVVTEATKLLQQSDGSYPHGQPAKRLKRGMDPGALRPESQFAAVPLPGDTATATNDGSGDDGDGSGGNGSGGHGSGGGSTSPQPQAALLLRPVLPHFPAAAAPSGASATPLVAANTGFYAHRAMAAMPQPPPWATALPPQYPQSGGYSASVMQGMQGMGPPGLQGGNGPAGYGGMNPMMMGDPMAWWYNTYYGQRQAAMQPPSAAPGMLPPLAQQQQQPGGAAPPGVGAPPLPPGTNINQLNNLNNKTAAKWWQDAQRTFGPPGDPEALAQVMAAAAAAANGGNGGEDARQEVESAPPSEARMHTHTHARGTTTGGNGAKNPKALSGQRRSMYSEDGPGGNGAAAAGANGPTTDNDTIAAAGKGGAAAQRSRRVRRKPADPIEEASSGTTGLGIGAGHHMLQDTAVMPVSSPIVADANVAKLLLAMGRGRALE